MTRNREPVRIFFAHGDPATMKALSGRWEVVNIEQDVRVDAPTRTTLTLYSVPKEEEDTMTRTQVADGVFAEDPREGLDPKRDEIRKVIAEKLAAALGVQDSLNDIGIAKVFEVVEKIGPLGGRQATFMAVTEDMQGVIVAVYCDDRCDRAVEEKIEEFLEEEQRKREMREALEKMNGGATKAAGSST